LSSKNLTFKIMNNTTNSLCSDGARRTFLKSCAAICAWMLMPFRNRAADGSPNSAAGEGLISGPDDGELLFIGPRKAPVRIQVGKSNGSDRLAMGNEDIVPGDGIPVHRHGREDEIIFIHAGEGTVTLGEERIVVKAGSSVYVPQGTWHGLENTGTELLKMVWVFSPAGFEEYFRDIGSRPGETTPDRSNDEWHAVDAKHSITYRQ
jgi:quercetin dioxygenase-like cupin family protein